VRVLVIDVGGSNVKALATGRREPVKIPSGPEMTARAMAQAVRKATAGWKYDAVSIGYPGPVVHGIPVAEPYNLGGGWTRFNFEKAFGHPVKIINDAAMQALGSYRGGRMLFLGLGTGLGSAMIVDGEVEPMELAHLPYKSRTYEDYLGERGRRKLGKKKWRKEVARVIQLFKAAFEPEDIVVGGGNVSHLKELPRGVRLGNNANAFVGGFRLWNRPSRKA
jgi:predicted NBD/HSP70 family sugar kinase